MALRNWNHLLMNQMILPALYFCFLPNLWYQNNRHALQQIIIHHKKILKIGATQPLRHFFWEFLQDNQVVRQLQDQFDRRVVIGKSLFMKTVFYCIPCNTIPRFFHKI